MIINMGKTKKRKYDSISDSYKTCKKKTKNNNVDSESDDDDKPKEKDETTNSEKDLLVYLKNNHLYFHTEVSEETVDKVKKLMRQYWQKISTITRTHECIRFTPKPLYLHIFSNGGCVNSGLSLYDFIIEFKKKIPVYTVVEGTAASAATFISVSGTKRFITPSSFMLIHQLSTFIGGNFEQIQDGYDNSKKYMDKIMGIYKTHTQIEKKKIPKILKHDIEWDSSECLKYGLVDKIKLIDMFNDEDVII